MFGPFKPGFSHILLPVVLEVINRQFVVTVENLAQSHQIHTVCYLWYPLTTFQVKAPFL